MQVGSIATTESSPRTDGATAGTAGQFLRIAIGQSMYAVAIDAVREILKVVQMTELPLMPDFVRGVMNLRGAVVPVIDLAARLGLGTAQNDRRTCIVIVDVDVGTEAGNGTKQTLGMMVDAVHEVVDFTPGEIEAVPALGTTVAPEFLAGMARVRGQIVPLLDIQRVLLLEELAALIASHTTH